MNTRNRIYVVDGYAGWDERYRINVRVVCARAYHALFMRNMLIRPSRKELESFHPDYVIYNAGAFPANRYTMGMTSSTSVAINFAEKEMVILGTEYAGEMKKGESDSFPFPSIAFDVYEVKIGEYRSLLIAASWTWSFPMLLLPGFANIAYGRAYHKRQRDEATPEFKAAQAKANKKTRPKTQHNRHQARANKDFYCAPCDYAADNNGHLNTHKKTKRHLKRVMEYEEQQQQQ